MTETGMGTTRSMDWLIRDAVEELKDWGHTGRVESGEQPSDEERRRASASCRESGAGEAARAARRLRYEWALGLWRSLLHASPYSTAQMPLVD